MMETEVLIEVKAGSEWACKCCGTGAGSTYAVEIGRRLVGSRGGTESVTLWLCAQCLADLKGAAHDALPHGVYPRAPVAKILDQG